MISTTHLLGRHMPVCLFLACVTVFITPRSQAEIGDGLVGYWPLDDTLEDTLNTNGDGRYDGILQGNDFMEYYSDGKFGSGIDLQGASDQRVEIGDFTTENDFDFVGGSVSISAWCKVTSFTKGWQALVAKGEGSGWRIARRGDGSNIMSYAGGVGDIPGDDNTGPNVNDGQFHHVVAVSEGGVSTRLWVDGQLVATGGAPNLEDRANPPQIGGNPDAAGRTWDGIIDDVAIWDRPLEDTEIAAIWNGGSGAAIGALLDPSDTDGDGMPNFWEEAEGTNPNVNDAALDPDGDGSPNLEEYERGTKPLTADTDGDGIRDGAESNSGTFVDADDTGTDPTKSDTDGDGLNDGVEDGGGVLVDPMMTGTDPNVVDTDMDTFTDYAEIVFGTDPNDIMSVIDGIQELPFVETFDDAIVNPAIWMIDNTIPQGGASVTVAGGHAVLAQRGHLVTVDQFDPETTNGLLVSGEWTFANLGGVDFLQILLRSDGIPDPVNCCGETQSGIEFRFSTDQTQPTIGTRGGDLAVTTVSTNGSLTVVQGTVVAFEITDDGEGNLSFTLTEVGNPANTATVKATLDVDFSDTNHIVFHNRESGGRIAHLDNVLITTLDDSDGDGMPDTWEIANMLDPNNPADRDQGANDGLFDNDGLTNLEEYQRGSNPNKADTDDDGLPDLVETGTGTWISPDDTGTFPANPDSDADGLRDGAETNTGRFVDASDAGSDPHDPDTDLDSYLDGAEAGVGSDPNNASSTPMAFAVVGYWPLDGTPEDAVGENDGVPIGGDPFYTDGQFGQAVQLSGAEYLELGPAENESQFEFVGGDMTVSAWFRVGAFTTSWQCLVAKGEGNSWRMHRRGDTTEMSFTGGNGDTPENFVAVDDGEIHHVVGVTRAGDVEELWLDGVLIATQTNPNLVSQNDLPPRIGDNPGAPGRNWIGDVDDVAIWGVALSEGDILRLWNDGNGTSVGEILGGAGAGPFRITEILYDTGNAMVDLTWTSGSGKIYAIYASLDLLNWDLEITDGVESQGDTTSFSFENPFPDQEAVYFRVQEL